jgi:tight adherence protein B
MWPSRAGDTATDRAGLAVESRLMRLARRWKRRRSEVAVEAALPDVLDRMASNLRAGAPPLVGLAQAGAGADLPEALVVDLVRTTERAENGGIGEALQAWAGECGLPAVAAAAGALEVAVSAGGPAAAALEGLAAGLRDRHDAAAEIAALSAQARLSAVVVGAAPVVSLALSLLADPRVARTLVGTAAGRSCLGAGIALEVAAALWMRRIVRCEP